MLRSTLFVLLAAAALTGSRLRAQAPAPTPPAWTRGATCYEVFVRSFADSDGDGIGDLRGLTQRLDYINDGDTASTRDLGARCIWLMPVAESPSYHGYDVSNYYRVEPDYGTNDDFKAFVREAHRRGIRVLVDMVINHASSEHPFFQAALRDTASVYRDWFRFSPTPGPKNRWGGDNWHRSPVRPEYYYGFFWGGMPDLDYDSPAVLREMKRVATYWLEEMEVDGFRLDAVRHLVEAGAVTENVPATHGILREYAAHVRAVKPSAYTIGEVWEPNEILMRYYPDQLDGYFAFEVADSIVAGVRDARAAAVLPPALLLQRQLPSTRYSPFLRNHDQPRTMTELGGDAAKARVASFILLTLPGMPFVYYGEEIGMSGAKPDERLRTPMQWTSAPGAGFTTGTPWQRLQDDSATTTVAAQNDDPRSLLALHRQLIHLRAAEPALGAGTLVPLTASHPSVLAYVRREGDDAVLVVANLSAEPLEGVTVQAPAGALPPGQALLRNLLGAYPLAAEPIDVAADGAVARYALPSLAPTTGYLLAVESALVRKD